MDLVTIFGEFGKERVEELTKSMSGLREKGYPDVIVLIASGGGVVEAGFDIYDLLRLYPGRKIGIVWKFARSMASFALQACEERYATPHARILIHHISRRDVSLDVLRSQRRIQRTVAELEKLQSMMYKVYAERTGKDIQAIKKECARERDMFPTEAKAFGLIDGIWDKSLPKV